MICQIGKLQAKHGIDADGKIGPTARQRIVDDLPLTPCTQLWPRAGACVKEQHDHWSRIAAACYTMPAPPGRLLLGLRGVAPKAPDTHAVVSVVARARAAR